MYSKLVLPGFIKATIGRKSFTRETLVHESSKSNRCAIFPASSVSLVAKTLVQKPRKSVSKDGTLIRESGKSNKCVIFSANNNNVSLVAKSLERKDHDWFVQSTVPSDLIIQVGDSSFHLHKLPVVSRSGYLNKVIFDRSNNNGARDKSLKIPIGIDNLPGGAKTFELVVKFCYGWEVDITCANIAPLYCAAQFLDMSDDLEQGNLISKTEAFLSFSIFSSWKDTFIILKSCENLSSLAKELQIVKRCSESIALKACTNLKDLSSGEDGPHCFHHLPILKLENKEVDHWWFEDVSSLRIDHFIEVIQSIKSKGMKPKLVGSCIAHWTTKWLSSSVNLSELDDTTYPNPKNMTTYHLQRVTIECLIRVLPTEENSVSCNFLLHLLKAGLALQISSELLKMLERRIAPLLELCRAPDLLVKNYGDSDNNNNVHDVGIVNKVVEAYASLHQINRKKKILVVGRLVDDYLTLVAREEKLHVKSFQSLVEALPKEARFCDDNLYRATDLYLKAHPGLTEDERTSLCRFLEYHRLSQDVREQVIKNNRLPLKIATRFMLLEQVSMTRSMASSNNNTTIKTHAFVRANNRSLGKEKCWKNCQKEIRKMTKDLETMNAQLNDLQVCKLKIQRQMLRCLNI
ncbi:root phototropism protein 3-like isoform X1 [Humulus lupulus]|uniref:root phototropism protein 3-like isoform X1 n=1 Tax=Humulus lupulus TaxID=3486 RepID=UPI002B40E2FD|nr:root phototropism protein 3-like isoform X1 [Humulus lupulus]